MTPLDYHVFETFRATLIQSGPKCGEKSEIAAKCKESRFTRLHRKGFLALVPGLPAHILQTLMILSSYMGEQRTCVMTSKQLSSDLGISREAARERLKALAAITVGGRPLITVEMTRAHTYWPGQYHIRFSPLVPVTCGGGEVRDELWVKHFDQARDLAKQLSPEAHVTLLALAVDMTETRTLRVPYRALATRLGVTLATAQSRIEELRIAGVITRLSNHNGNEYRVETNVPLMFGAEEHPEGWELERVEINLASVSESRWCTSSDPHIKRRKELKEEKTTTPAGVTKSSSENNGSGVVEKSSSNKKPGKSDVSQVGEGEKNSESETQKAAIGENLLPFAGQVGSKTTAQWVERFGLERCLEVWGKAQLARSPGGYMRKALSEGWEWIKPEVLPQRRYWEVTAEERAADIERLLGVKIDVVGPVADSAKVLLDIPNLRKKLRA